MGAWDEGLFDSDGAADVAMDAAGAPAPMVEGFLREAMARWDDEEDAADPAAAVALVLFALDPTGIESHAYVSGWPRQDWVPTERLVADARALGERLLAEVDADDEDARLMPAGRAQLRALLDRTRGVPAPQAPLAQEPAPAGRRRWPFGRRRD